MARNRIIYASQSVWANGNVLYRVQSFGSTTTFTSEDIFELGHLDIIDVVDDVPAVAITLNTNEFGDVETMATLAQVESAKAAMSATATVNNANLVVVSGSNNTVVQPYLHGACLSDFAVSCGSLPGITVWAPVQEECSLGTLADNIDQTLFLDEVYINSLEFSYTTGANATENYGAECDNKMWLLNDGRFVNWMTMVQGVDDTLTISGTLPTLSFGTDNTSAFLRKDSAGAPAASWYDSSAGTVANYPVVAGAAGASNFGWSGGVLTPPTGWAAGDEAYVVWAADMYDPQAAATYFDALAAADRPSDIGAVRQGQIEAFLVSPADISGGWDLALRLTGVTITADMTREPLSELGHLGPYDRPMTLPIPITVTVDTTAGDLETWAKVAQQLAGYDAGTLDDIDLTDLLSRNDLKLVVKIYAQTDEEAGGTSTARTVATGADIIGDTYFIDGTAGTFAAGSREYALKTIIVENLKITDEGMTLDVGANATQTFGFRSTNDLYVVKGDLSYINVVDKKIRRNA